MKNPRNADNMNEQSPIAIHRDENALTITLKGHRAMDNLMRVETALRGRLTPREIVMLSAPEDLALLALDGGAAAYLCRVMG